MLITAPNPHVQHASCALEHQRLGGEFPSSEGEWSSFDSTTHDYQLLIRQDDHEDAAEEEEEEVED